MTYVVRVAFIYLLLIFITIIGFNCTELPEPDLRLNNKVTLLVNDAESLSSSAVTISGSVTCSVDNLAGKERGVVMSTTNATPTTGDTKYAIGSGTGSFSARISNLLPSKQYYYRPYIILNSTSGIIYGEVKKFTTLAIPATVSTSSLTNISYTTATGGGSVTTDGGSSITQRGICWNTTGSPTISNSRTINGSGLGSFSSSITGLNPATTYYVRAYAVNALGTTYGNEVSFVTSSLRLPVISTNSISSITTSSAVSGGNITDDGGAAIIQRGVCWNTVSNPTTSNSRTIDGSGVGIFTSNITGLNRGTIYYVRAYASNSVGTAYGPQLIFSTNALLPSVSSGTVSSITTSSATYSDGIISSDGGGAITDRGVCWSTSANPTVSNSRVSLGSGAGNIAASITGLNPSTTYYVRAYATNSAGTAYSTQLSFTTTCQLLPPTLSYPSNGSTVPCCYLSFGWSQPCGATGYQVQISKSSTFSYAVTTLSMCGGSSYPNPNSVNQSSSSSSTFCMNTGSSSNNGVWYWRVRSSNGVSFSAWSSTYSYTYRW